MQVIVEENEIRGVRQRDLSGASDGPQLMSVGELLTVCSSYAKCTACTHFEPRARARCGKTHCLPFILSRSGGSKYAFPVVEIIELFAADSVRCFVPRLRR